MSVEQSIREKLTAQFSPHILEIENESHMHSSARGTESHFKVTLVAETFVGQRSVARHQTVYACLAQELTNGVHALALHLYSPAEWRANSGSVTESPRCAGVGL